SAPPETMDLHTLPMPKPPTHPAKPSPSPPTKAQKKSPQSATAGIFCFRLAFVLLSTDNPKIAA
ncbi:hypothetical protein, partial [Pseudomonas abietaniphila]|uniref:hypothetical protein n=1 Tax=Pseudomonas abietaniphila TaxID=89065 RepID=UPI001EE72E82